MKENEKEMGKNTKIISAGNKLCNSLEKIDELKQEQLCELGDMLKHAILTKFTLEDALKDQRIKGLFNIIEGME